LSEPADRNLRPRRDDVSDVFFGHLDDLIALRFALLPLFLEPRSFEPQRLFPVARCRSFFKLLGFDDSLFLGQDLAQLGLDLTDLRRRQRSLQANARAGFVDEIDGLIGQEAIGNVSVSELGCRHERLVGDLHLMVRLVAISETLQNFDRLLDAGLADQHGLEAPLERRVLLDVFAKLVERRRADALQFATRERRLDDVAGVDRAFGRTRADQRVQFVDKQDDLAGRAADLVHDALHPFLEFAAVLRAGDEAREIQGDHALVAQRVGDIALDDALRQPFGDRRLADARFADECGIILGTAGEDLNDALDLARAADDRIELVFAGEHREIAAVGVQRRRLALALRCRGLPFGAEQRGRLEANLRRIDPEIGQHARGHALALANQPEEQMLGADVVVVELARLFKRKLDDALGARREDHLLLNRLPAATDDGLDFLTNFCEVDAEALEHFCGQALAFRDDAEQNVLRPDIVISKALRFFLRKDDTAACALGKRFPH